MPNAGSDHRFWSLILHPFEEPNGVPSKTGEYDETLLLDKQPFLYLGGCLAMLIRHRQPTELVFHFSQREFQQAVSRAGAALRLDPPPQLTHRLAQLRLGQRKA